MKNINTIRYAQGPLASRNRKEIVTGKQAEDIICSRC